MVVSGIEGSLPENAPLLLTAICRSRGNQLHCAVVVNRGVTERFIIDLAWHHLLRKEEYRDDYICYATGLDERNQRFVAGLAELVAKAEGRTINYGFDFSGLKFLPNGSVSSREPGKGMTCASFIYVLLNTLSLPPVDLIDWPVRPDDEEWKAGILEFLRAGNADEEHVAAIEAGGDSTRLRPEEIVAAVSLPSSEWPRHFEEIVEPSLVVRAMVPS